MYRFRNPLSIEPPPFARWIDRWRGGVLIAMLALLHLALLQSPESAFGRTLMMAHFGAFLLWQPLVRSEVRLAWLHLAGLSLVMLLAIVWMNWMLMALWLMVLAGLVGGRVFFHSDRGTRLFFLLALSYLVAVLLLWAVPRAVPELGYSHDAVTLLRRYAFPVILFAMVVVPVEKSEDAREEAIDLVYTMFVVFLLIALTQGTVAYALLYKGDYLTALVKAMLALAAVLVLVSWMWSPRLGFSGLSAIASRYALSIGLPLEQWLHSLTELYERESSPLRMLEGACLYMVRNLPWISGGTWKAGGREGSFGQASLISTPFSHEGLELTLYTRHSLSPSLKWHFDLVAQLLAHFYRAKESDRDLREMAYVQAVHETGARLTHDVKNLLQSLNGLIFAARQEGETGGAAYQSLLSRQLPVVAKRLEQTLAKLKYPDLDKTEYVSIGEWWTGLQCGHPYQGVVFSSEGDLSGGHLPGTLFTHACENLLQNAVEKRQMEPGIRIEVCLSMGPDGRASLSVIDSGSAIAEGVARDLGVRPVLSEKGFGISLYQLARGAALNGYCLELAENRPGLVVWVLRPAVSA